jgi:hypothetical protein
MSVRLLACPRCARHVRVSEKRCPFCVVGLPDHFGDGPAPVPPPRGLSRAGLVSYGALRVAAGAGVLASALASSVAITAGCESNTIIAYGLPADSFAVYGIGSSCTGDFYVGLLVGYEYCDSGEWAYIASLSELPSGYTLCGDRDSCAGDTSDAGALNADADADLDAISSEGDSSNALESGSGDASEGGDE